MRVRIVGAWGALVAVGVVASCGADHRGTSSDRVEAPLSATALTPSSDARDSVEVLRERFRITPMARPDRPGRVALPAPKPVPVIGKAIATSFEPIDGEGGRVRAVIPIEAKRVVLRAASVELPMHANSMVRLEDDVTKVSVSFALRGASDVAIAVGDGMAVYAGALGGSDVVHRVHAEGTEDFVVFEERPAKEELVYEVDVSRVAGLRLVSNTLEFLDEGGAPRLRVAPPYVVDARGVRSEARLAVEGCAYDTDTSGPWGRAVTKAGAASCVVRVAWGGPGYPLMVDPSWMTTGSMTTWRSNHTATLLTSGPNAGKVLIVGGLMNIPSAAIPSAELFDGLSSFAATGSMAKARSGHTATLLPSGKVLIAGGSFGITAELFDGSGSFAPTGSMTAVRVSQTATLLTSGPNAGKVLIAGGGTTPTNAVASAELFDGTSSFAPTGSMTAARLSHTATLLTSGPNAGKVLIAGGGSPNALASAELFDGTSSFAPTGSMANAREYHTATLLPSGKVLVAGGDNIGDEGNNSNGVMNSAELFDGTATFALTGAMSIGRRYHTATLLPSGRVLVAGGSLGEPSAELFDGSATFADTAGLVALRLSHTATFLPSGRVLAAGGYIGGNTLDSAELFGQPVGVSCAAASDCGSDVCNENCCLGACASPCTTCDGTGACVAVKNADDPNTCSAVLNKSTCDGSGLCKKAQGQACALNGDCLTGFCADGFCCNSACGSACDVCAQSLGASADGTCSPAPVGYAGSPACGDGLACDGASTACPPSCTSASDCLKGDFCVDGVCCNAMCTGECEACDVAGHSGTCVPVPATDAPHGTRTPCTATGAKCGGTCDGKNAAACSYPNSTTVCATSCTKGEETDSACDGNGACITGKAHACPGTIATCASPTACTAACVADTDCTEAFVCKTGMCIPKAGSTCAADGHTVDDSAGTPTDCTPYICSGGMCTMTCASVDDCVAPNVCDATLHCVAPALTSDDSGASGGCSFIPGSEDASPSRTTLLLAIALSLSARRRRRARV